MSSKLLILIRYLITIVSGLITIIEITKIEIIGRPFFTHMDSG